MGQREKYFFPAEITQEERKLLAKKAEWYMNFPSLPREVICPVRLLEDGKGQVCGYLYETPDFPFLTLKELFRKEKVEQYHVDGHLLFSIARKLLYLLMELSEQEIYPGLIDLSCVLVHEKRPDKGVLLWGVEHFQAGELPSTFPWYPSDSRLFDEDFFLFDGQSQKKADAKLIYRVLTMSGKGNAKIPPNPKTQERSYLFWNILSREWKDFFLKLSEKDVDYPQMLKLLEESIEEEKHYTSPMERRTSEETASPAARGTACRKAYAAIAVLRAAGKSAHDVSRLLYLLQDRLEEDREYAYEQAFILGDGHVFARDFASYPEGFRSQLAHRIKEYSFGEALLIGCGLLDDAIAREDAPSFFYILLDGEIKNDGMFCRSLERLKRLKLIHNTQTAVLAVGESQGEGYAKLMELCGGSSHM